MDGKVCVLAWALLPDCPGGLQSRSRACWQHFPQIRLRAVLWHMILVRRLIVHGLRSQGIF